MHTQNALHHVVLEWAAELLLFMLTLCALDVCLPTIFLSDHLTFLKHGHVHTYIYYTYMYIHVVYVYPSFKTSH